MRPFSNPHFLAIYSMDAQIEFIPAATGHVSTLVLHLSGAAMSGKRQ
jgi:hypothetical protein